jgi:hypothetical protein
VVADHVITTTEDHPFWNATDQQWQPAEQLEPGDQLLTANGTTVTVEGINQTTVRNDTAYNITVAETHTYYVLAGNTPVLVHNTGPAGCPTGLPNPAGGYPSYRGPGGWITAQGEAGPGLTWEHVVEQSQMSPGRSGFPSSAINNVDNILFVTPEVNFAKNYYYGSKLSWTGGMRLRDYMAAQGWSWQQQWDFGMDVISRLQNGTPLRM